MDKTDETRRPISVGYDIPEHTFGDTIYVQALKLKDRTWISLYSDYPFDYNNTKENNLRVIKFDKGKDSELSGKVIAKVLENLAEENNGFLDMSKRCSESLK